MLSWIIDKTELGEQLNLGHDYNEIQLSLILKKEKFFYTIYISILDFNFLCNFLFLKLTIGSIIGDCFINNIKMISFLMIMK